MCQYKNISNVKPIKLCTSSWAQNGRVCRGKKTNNKLMIFLLDHHICSSYLRVGSQLISHTQQSKNALKRRWQSHQLVTPKVYAFDSFLLIEILPLSWGINLNFQMLTSQRGASSLLKYLQNRELIRNTGPLFCGESHEDSNHWHLEFSSKILK